ncbi:MAG: phosphomannomutase/phosphoglucomutase [Spongiibacteraceae bacterium]
MAKKNSAEKSVANAQPNLMKLAVRGFAIGMVVVTAAFAYLIAYEIPTRNTRVLTQLSQELASGQVQIVDSWVKQTQQRLQSLASDPNLLAQFSSDATATIDTLSFQRAFPEASNLRLIKLGPLGIASLDNNQAGLRNNIEADMLRRVSDGSNAQPEAYQLEQKWVISFVQAVAAPGEKYAAGAILLTLPATHLEQLLADEIGPRGATDLLQQAGGKPANFAHAGSGDATDFAQTQTGMVKAWQLQITPASAWIAQLQQTALQPLLLLVVSLIGILIGLFVCIGDFRAALERSINALLSNQPAELPGFAELRQQLQTKFAAVNKEPAAETKAAKNAEKAAPAAAEQVVEELDDLPVQMPDTIFRAYDIRGIASHQLTDDIVYHIGLAIGSEALDRGQQEIIVARDGRASSESISSALIRGLQDSGRDVLDIGMVPTPLMYFATHQLGVQSGVMVTGSHNTAEYNGMKIVIGGKTLSGRAIEALRQRIQERHFSKGKGGYRSDRINEHYIDYIMNDVAIAQPLKIVVDAGNGVTGIIAPQLFEQLGCEVIPLYCDIDPKFPHHDPDPTIARNLRDLVDLVRESSADLGIAFDGDGDRVAVVTASGEIVAADRLLMVLAQDVVARNPGADVLFDVKCTRSLNNVISSFGGRPIMWKSGHSFMKDKMAETGALVGGEFSGHIFFNERWFGFDDGMYAASRLIEILSTTDPNLDSHLNAFPTTLSTPELKIPLGDEAKFALMERLATNGKFGDGKLTTLDGLRVDFPDGWGLVRASNTTPALTLRFEADNEAALERIQTLFKDQLKAIDPQLAFDF